MNLFQFGNVLIDIGDVVYAAKEGDETVLKLRGGHEINLGGDVGAATWRRLSGGLIDQLPRFHSAENHGIPA